MVPLVQIKNLNIGFKQNSGTSSAVRNINFDLYAGKLTAIVGESGSGKSVTALSILKLLPAQTEIEGEILLQGDDQSSINIRSLSAKAISDIRGNKISMIFQEPMTSLNPVYTCGDQVIEVLQRHKKLSYKEARLETLRLFEEVALPFPTQMLKRYPHQISGGQKQRVMIAMAMCCQPQLLIADEPTTALDVRVQKNILALIKKFQVNNNTSVLLITHDLALVADVADEIIVMYKGHIVGQGKASDVLQNPQHPYTKALLACRPNNQSKGKRLPVISDFLNKNQEDKKISIAENHYSSNLEINPSNSVLQVENLVVSFPEKKNIFGKTISELNAVDHVSFTISKNEIVGLVGESGCGKTTLGRTIIKLVEPKSGKIILNGTDIAGISAKKMRSIRKDLQVVFQDPYGSLNPRITVGDAMMETLFVHQLHANKKERKAHIEMMLEKVNLDPGFYNRYPHQFSGGQRQRICIARALALDPKFLIFDESVSALDVSVQAQVLNLINDLKKDFGFTAIFISHDLSVVHHISDRIMVMQKGKIIESGDAHQLFFHPKESYTQQLLAAIPGQKLF